LSVTVRLNEDVGAKDGVVGVKASTSEVDIIKSKQQHLSVILN